MTSRVVDETKRVIKAARTGTIKSLGRAGAYIRGIARRSIGKGRGKPSAPGKPPYSRTGRLKDSILYSVDKAAGTVVIGPTKSGIGRIGQTHEFGGTEPRKRGRRRGQFDLRIGGHGPVRARRGKVVGVGKLRTQAQVERAQSIVKQLNLPQSASGIGRSKRRRYPKRPFMAPALEISKSRLPEFWRNSIKGG